MSETVDSFQCVPEHLILSGEGLHAMELEHFKTLVRNLTRMQIDVIELSPEAIVEMAAELKPKDVPLHEVDFQRAGETSGLIKAIAPKTWNFLVIPWRRYNEAKLRDTDVPGRLFDPRKFSLPSWHQELCLNDNEISYNGLRAAFLSEVLDNVYGIGPTSLSLIESVLADTEQRLETAHSNHK